MTGTDKPNGAADAAERLRKVARGEPIIDSSIEPSLPNSPSPLAYNPHHDLASAVSEQLQVRISAEHLLMLASSTQQPANNVVVDTIVANADDALMNMPVVDARQESGLAATTPASSSGYSTPETNFENPLQFASVLAY
ncbi:hypothetical protein B9Z19DRAFT_1134119 [Tuber borchii]|uniref:Uncharacterized protein n=1 Tax=Tuber borchii TaxID=42251 RepID=A0A2T6ZEK8_TUBBO|nr:hypothetical protein B9Z19DRAFT_1134119 [Tuber borchii]